MGSGDDSMSDPSEQSDHVSSEQANGSRRPIPSIKVVQRKERSLLMHLLQMITKPIKRQLTKPRKVYSPGSPRLTPPGSIRKRFEVQERQVDDVWVYDLTARPSSQKQKGGIVGAQNGSTDKTSDGQTKKKRIIYFAGGGWQMEASGEHWALLAELVRRLPDTIVSLVSYPLAPNSPVSFSFPVVEKVYGTLLRQAELAGERVIVAGDSAGGNIALSLVAWVLSRPDGANTAVTNDNNEEKDSAGRYRIPAPAAILVISPSTDLRRTNPDIERVAKHDPILSVQFIKATASAWRGASKAPTQPPPTNNPPSDSGRPENPDSRIQEWSAEDPRVSPIFADLTPLAERNVKVHGVTGTYDILGPDAVLFRDKCNAAGIEGEWLEWEKQMHVFPLVFRFGLWESKEGVRWMTDVLRRT